jgi:NADPH:quinone reductase
MLPTRIIEEKALNGGCPVFQHTHQADLALAAATIVNGATAVMAMEAIAPAASVAISGASGGLGRSPRSGCRADHSGLRKGRSAGEVFSARRIRLAALAEELDVACDTMGGETHLALLRALRPGGRLTLLGNASGSDPAL